MKNALAAFSLVVLLGLSAGASAHADFNVYQTLGVSEPSVLPGSFWYPFKEFGRGFKRAFTFNAVAKAELEIRITDENLAELAKLSEKEPDAEGAHERALQNYLDAHKRLAKRLEELRGKNKNMDTLLEKIATKSIDHQRIFAGLDELKPEAKTKSAKAIAGELKVAATVDKTKLIEKLAPKVEEPDDYELFEGIEESDELFEKEVGRDLGREVQKRLLDKKERDTRECGPMPGRPTPEGCTGPVCKEGKWQFICPPPIPAPPAGTPPSSGKPAACTQQYDPVCGVDGKTYSNACLARVVNVQVKYSGECKICQQPPKCDGNLIYGDPLRDNPDQCPRYACIPRQPPPPNPSPIAPPPPPEVRTQEFKLEADDRGFYPSGTITVGKDTKVKLTFIVRTENVYYGGLDFRSPKFKTQSVKPGDSVTVEFTADQSFEFQSYWPLSSVLKAVGKVEVQ